MSFLNRLFLAAAVTALLPILIHLVQRRRALEVVFGSLRLLRRTSHRVVHRRRFEEFLLVVLRALALAALAFGFARPFFPGPKRAGYDERARGQTFAGEEAALLLIDNSYSMQAEGRLERAKEEALAFLRQLGPATRVGVAACSSQFDELCPLVPLSADSATTPLARAEEAVKGIEPSWRGTKLALALTQANRLLTRAVPGVGFRRIVLFGDFQNSSWKSRDNVALAPGIELAVHNVGGKAVPNVFVERVAVPRLAVAGGSSEVVSASIRNLTDSPLNDAQVTFRVNGQAKGTASVNIRPGEEAPVRFHYKFTESGDEVGSIAVQATDGLPADNLACFCVHVSPRVRVLLVNADRTEKLAHNQGLFIKTALVPGIEGVASPFEVRELAPAEMAPRDLDGQDVVLFANVSRLPAALTEVPQDKRKEANPELHSPLGRFLSAGGGIGFFCGKKVVPEEFNRTFAGLAPCQLSRLAMQEGDPPLVINQVDLRHEIFAEFAQPHTGDFSLPEFTQYFLVTDSLRARVLARFSNKDAHPALLEHSLGQEAENGGKAAVSRQSADGAGEPARPLTPPSPPWGEGRVRGKSLLFVSPLNLEWNNLCLKSVFVPFVHQFTKRLCAQAKSTTRNFVVGEEIVYSLPPLALPSPQGGSERGGSGGPPPFRGEGGVRGLATQEPGKVTLRRLAPPQVSSGKTAGASSGSGELVWENPVELKVQTAGSAGAGAPPAKIVSFSPEKPGLYELAYQGGKARFAVNLDPKEPDLRPLDTALFLSAVTRPGGVRHDEDGSAVGLAPAAALAAQVRIEAQQRAWWYIILGVLGLLGCEMWLATRIGRA